METIDDLVRPTSWDDFVGQPRLKRRLEIKIDSAKHRADNLDPLLLVAPPGTGKTTLAKLVAERLDDPFVELMMPMKTYDFLDALEEEGQGVAFLDELHNAPKAFQEMLQPALERGYIMSPGGIRIDVSRFSFIGATIPELRPSLRDALVSRFKGNEPVWEPYRDEEIARIIEGMATRMQVELPTGVCAGLARAAGGTPRFASALVAAARDLAEVGRPVTVPEVLALAGVDQDGLTDRHHEYLRVLHSLGDRAGLRTLVTVLRSSNAALEELERLLMERGYVRLEPNGRKLTPAGKAKLLPKRTNDRRRVS